MTSHGRIGDIQDLEKGARVATSILQQRANDVRANVVNWKSYLQGQMISNEVYNFISNFDKAGPEERASMISSNPMQFAAIFRNLIDKIAKDQTLQYILTMLDDALQEDHSRVDIFKEYAKKRKESVWQPFFLLLERSDMFIVHQSSRIVAKIACWSKEPMDRRNLQSYLIWLKEQLKHPVNEYHSTVARCLQMMMRIDSYRQVFVDVDGIAVISSVLVGHEKIGFQIVYQLIFCLWCLSFNTTLVERMNRMNLIPVLADILSSTQREKVTRIILALFRNMLEKPEERSVTQEYALSMVRCKVVKQLELLDARKWEDPDLEEDIKWISAKLETSVQDLSSFDEYVSEVKSGNLEWSPVHRTDRFWRENAIRLNDKNYELLKILVRLLETSRDALVLSVAAHDIGEYVRYYPRGKHIIEQLGAKQLVMQYLTHPDPNVRYEALIAVQKLMVHNWEYLGKKMTAEDHQPKSLVSDTKA
ncbi:V-type proton ATPase subunit H-like isoform X1 [Babylonia areolata]|uniref:V-type proton ATPase subunit H-like isoform X1 n=1 Tax=Babylonia areolata TaxID=304850 RepID=UPI003FD2F792